MFLGLKNLFVGSLPSESLHGLELVNFLTIPGNTYCHDTLSWNYNLFMDSLPSIPCMDLKSTEQVCSECARTQ